MSEHSVKPNYRNIILACIIAVLAIVVLVLIIKLAGKKEPQPLQSSSAPQSSSVYETSSEESSIEESSSETESDSTSSSSSRSSESSKPNSSKITIIPSTPYNYDTTGKTVRNAFDANGEIDLLFPINTTYYITKNFSVNKTEKVDGDYVMDHRAAPHCREMLAAMKSELGSGIAAFSTLRTFSYQEGNFQRKMNKYLNKGYSKEDAYNEAATIVAIPGTSEHQLGLAIDVYLWDLYNRDGELNESFEGTKEYRWLQEHAHEYGFILSFPKDKIANTGIIYEPWHYRYVGIENAKIIKDSGMTLAQWLDSQNIVYVYNGK